MNSPAEINDLSNGYEKLSADFIERRNASTVGAKTVRDWAQAFSPNSTILDIGCGNGVPISQTLIELGFEVYGVDASVSMIEAFRQQFPKAQAACEPIENSSFFNRQFDGVISWGLFFLLPAATQVTLIGKVANALRAGGKFLFTAPYQICSWDDQLTGRKSQSLGRDAYTNALAAAGCRLIGEYTDEGENHYFDAEKQ